MMVRAAQPAVHCMDLELREKIVLITGGSKGIGLACTKAFLAEGASVAIASRSEANLANAHRILRTALTIAADLEDDQAAAGVVDAVERARADRHTGEQRRRGPAHPARRVDAPSMAGGDGCQVLYLVDS
jgi:NAD(P)-dependent dehydrogenase (short-subunit alcohol dehydrogenase family)